MSTSGGGRYGGFDGGEGKKARGPTLPAPLTTAGCEAAMRELHQGAAQMLATSLASFRDNRMTADDLLDTAASLRHASKKLDAMFTEQVCPAAYQGEEASAEDLAFLFSCAGGQPASGWGVPPARPRRASPPASGLTRLPSIPEERTRPRRLSNHTRDDSKVDVEGLLRKVAGYQADLADAKWEARRANRLRDRALEERDKLRQELNALKQQMTETGQRQQSAASPTKAPPCAQTAAPVVDTRPVRGVIELQAHPTKESKATGESVLLIAGKGTLKVQEMHGSFPDILKLPLGELLVKLVPGFDCGFVITVVYSADDAEEVYAALPNSRMRNKWLEALTSLGARVEGEWEPVSSDPDIDYEVPCALGGQPPPIRWIH